MFRWNLMLRTRFGSHRQETKARRLRKTVRLRLEALEDRTLPSASSLPVVTVASPPAAPQSAAITSVVDSMVQQQLQVIDTIVQYASNVWNTLGQELIQEVAALQLQVGHILGFDTNTPTPSSNAAASQLSSDRGAGQDLASGSGSSSGATTTARENPHPRLEKALPLTDSGVGSGSASGPYSGSATVTGWVWLDNNADGSQDQSNVEMDYSGATVDLLKSTDNGASWSFCSATTTSSATQGYNYSLQTGFPVPNNWLYKIQVIFPSYFAATTPSAQSYIDAQGYSPVFSLAPGAMQVVPAGLVSMNVNTTADDPNGPTQQNTVTLRDAMLTGNNLKPFPAVTFYTNPQTGQQLSGSIGLQQALPSIQKSYNITGPGSTTLTVNGNNNAGTIFTVTAGVGSTISGLTITGGAGANGGGIYNEGDLTLNDIVLKNNQTAGKGGGIYNDSDAQLSLQTVTIGTAGNPNTATQGGGGLYNSGSVTIHDSVIVGNAAGGGGGGIYNYEGTIQAFDDTEINHNSDNGLRGGGVYNTSGKFQMYGGYIPDNQETKSDGGGVYNRFGTMTLTGVSVLGNRAIGYGGGIYSYEGSLTLTHNVFIGSSAGTDRNFAHRGGGMYVNGSVVKMTGGAITNNTATTPTTGGGAGALSGGGGLYVNAGSLTLTNVSISHNGSMTNGGGVYVRSGSLKLINDIITYNANGGFGGGMLIKGGTVTVSGGTFQYNQAGNGAGGGIYNYTGILTLNSYAIGGNIFPVLMLNNYAFSNGGGMFLANGSKTTFNDASVSGNTTFVNTQTTGRGVFEQQFATVNITGVLNDKDDDGGVPYRTGVT